MEQVDKQNFNTKEETDSSINFFTFSQIENNQPKFKLDGRKEWISYGDDNLYPNYLIELLNGSPIHNEIVKKKVDMTSSGGFKYKTSLESIINNPYGSEHLNDIVYKNTYDLMYSGAFALLVTWSKDKSVVSRVQYISIDKIRIAKPLENPDTDAERYEREQEGVEFYYISQDWSNTRKNKPELIQGFSEQYKDALTQLYYVKEYRPTYEWYTLPDYIPATPWIELDREIANYHLNSAKNGFTPSMVINFPTQPTAEEQRIIAQKLKEQYQGTDNANKVFLTFSPSPETKPEIIPINLNDNDDRFTTLTTLIAENIMMAHRANAVIVGIQTAGKLGSSTEVEEYEDLFQRQVIYQKQQLIERSYNRIFNRGGNLDMLELVNITITNKEGEIKE